MAQPPLQNASQVRDCLTEVQHRVQKALLEERREPGEVTILSVSKQQPITAVEELFRAGQVNFGENFVQEATKKIAKLDHLNIDWHFIGHIQSNKTRDIAEQFQWVHTVDRMRVATRLNDQRPHHLPPLNVCIQVNQAKEPQKGGADPISVEALARGIIELPCLQLRGLMTIPPTTQNPADNARFFAKLRNLKEQLVTKGIPMDTLSMGMSSDLEIAIREGSTIVRIGTAIFGPRTLKIKNPNK
ncbi:MAG: YggS family pyridoxal phosphate-dependent enzyme [Pseudomonadota bacterium]|nr:YggS family pyridoxal phosphate-dependent enzyme [Pseudomonadota bacterium]